MIYLDNNATTQVDTSVVECMQPYFLKEYGNPSALHHFGRIALDKINHVRLMIARLIGCEADEIIFTHSGSEGNNLCIKGYAFANRHKGNHIITTAIEHPSVLNTCAFLEEQGFAVTYLSVDSQGFVDPEELRREIRDKTILVSIAHANNEIGTIQPIKLLSQVAPHLTFHTDAVQSFLKTVFNVKDLGVDLASFSGHKFHAPKGVGFIYKRNGIDLTPQVHGGHQEMSLRAGTENVPGIVGLGQAIEGWSPSCRSKMQDLQRHILDRFLAIPGIRLNGPEDLERRICSNINISSDALEGETLVNELSHRRIYVSTGSACSSKHTKVSHVLKAIGCPAKHIHSNIRVSLSRHTSKKDVRGLLSAFSAITTSKNPFMLQ